uniref:Uncharacterized protein n=1 Tax=Siphoviridae sp. ctsoB6 TaxID=2826487 RepID=A0A8S5QNB5_9CAUD|nr:MAG TPA: hypothetical protein [Siphoviridae sp. ctsoB6]
MCVLVLYVCNGGKSVALPSLNHLLYQFVDPFFCTAVGL